MEELFSALYYDPEYFILLLLRVSGLLFVSPIFGRQSIPVVAKIGYCACIAIMFYAAVPQTQPLNYNDDLFLFILLCVKELLFGMVMGYVVNVFFMLTYTAGQIIDMQMGFGMVNVFDVQTNISVPVTANMLNIVMILSFFAVNGHHRLYYILYESLEQIPIGAIVINPNIGWIALQLFIEAFILAVIVAMPIIGSGLVGEACFGILMKAVPQMNAFSIGIPIKMLLGFLVLAAMMPFFVRFTNTVFDQMYTGLDRMFAALTG